MICRGGAYMTQAKILAVRDAEYDKSDVTYTVATHNKRVAEWTGSPWYFCDPGDEVEHLQRKATYFAERADRITARILKTKGVV